MQSLNVFGDDSREGLEIVLELGLSVERIARSLDPVIARRGRLQIIR